MSTVNQNPGCLAPFLRLFSGAPAADETLPAGEETFPYRLRDDFLTPAELSFYRVLASMVGERAVVCPKISLRELFFIPRTQERRSASNRINQKHVDFVLCDPATMRPLLGVELDDSSHARADRKERDAFVEGVFEAAGLPLVRIPVQRGYTSQDLAARVDPFLGNGTASAASPVVAPGPAAMPLLTPSLPEDGVPAAPLCPTCGVPMVVRKATRGERPGQEFFGCPNYPKCRKTLLKT